MACIALAGSAALVSTGAHAATWRAELDDVRVDVERAVGVRDVDIDLGGGTLRIARAALFPTTAVVGRPVELVVIGDATLLVDPPSAVDAGQLELFAGSSPLATPVDRAVVVLGDGGALAALTDRPSDVPVTRQDGDAARAVFDAWRASPERFYLDVGSATLAIVEGDGGYAEYAAAWLDAPRFGALTLVHDPNARDPVLLGCYVPRDVRDLRTYVLNGPLDERTPAGDPVPLALTDLGAWDTWVRGPRATPDGPRGGAAGFEPVHLTVDAEIRSIEPDIWVRVALDARATEDGRTVLPFDLSLALEIVDVTDADGLPVRWRREGRRTLVPLPRPVAVGETVRIVVHYRGDLLEDTGPGAYRSRATSDWLPRVGTVGRATYDLRFTWPDHLDLVAGGTPIREGRRNGLPFLHTRLDVPALSAAFEVGTFDVVERRLGPLVVRVAVPKARSSTIDVEVLLDAASAAVSAYQESFGGFPLERLTVAFVPRGSSGGSLGLATLSRSMLADQNPGRTDPLEDDERAYRLARRIAHEIAHQWWGHRVGWTGESERWLGEALAGFCEERFVRSYAGGGAHGAGGQLPVRREPVLPVTLDRPDHAHGPPVLGRRLISTRSDGAYRAVVDDKGSRIVSMVADRLGPDRLEAVLGEIARAYDHGTLDTRTMFRELEVRSGVDLDTIVDAFVYGTSYPWVVYDHRIAATGDGGRGIRGTAESYDSFHRRLRVERYGEDGWDVGGSFVHHGSPGGVPLTVPYRVTVDGRSPSDDEAMTAEGTVAVGPGTTPVSIPVEGRPTSVRLDPDRRSFARLVCAACEPALADVVRAEAWIARGRREAAAEVLEKLLHSVDGQGRRAERGFAHSPEAIFARARLAALHLDADRVDEAERLLGEAELSLRRRPPEGEVVWTIRGIRIRPVPSGSEAIRADRIERELLALRARLLLRGGRIDDAWELLSGALYLDLPARKNDSTEQDYLRTRLQSNALFGDGETYALLAVAACVLDRREVCAAATREADLREVDLDALTDALEPPGP